MLFRSRRQLTETYPVKETVIDGKTAVILSKLHYVVGVLEGVSYGANKNVAEVLTSSAEKINDVIGLIEEKERE